MKKNIVHFIFQYFVFCFFFIFQLDGYAIYNFNLYRIWDEDSPEIYLKDARKQYKLVQGQLLSKCKHCELNIKL